MHPLEKPEKNKLRLRFAAAIDKALPDRGFPSGRQFALTAGMEQADFQKIYSAKRDASLPKIIAIANGLTMSFPELATYYANITEEEIQVFEKKLEEQKTKKGKKTASKKSDRRK